MLGTPTSCASRSTARTAVKPPTNRSRSSRGRLRPYQVRSNDTNTSIAKTHGAVTTDQQPRSHHTDRTSGQMQKPAAKDESAHGMQMVSRRDDVHP